MEIATTFFCHWRRQLVPFQYHSAMFSPGLALGKLVDLLLEVDNDLLVFPLEQVSCLFGFQMDVLQQFAELGQLGVTLSVDLELEIEVRVF